ncbi:type IV secretory system conjugative DNA transfer family protein, partial [Actinoplanes sp. NPDC051633]|uniref:type IV secretory system conjugative DNA transfer family protein n=1 Tax=Actinoplanes sp. NPDC051633 TaxID=3155670 RepID=UPI0034343F6D
GRIFASLWGPRIVDTLRVACLTLLRKANATLTLIPPLLNDKRFRTAFTQDLDDPEGLRGYWEWFESTPPPLRAQVIGPVLARLRAFLLRDFVRRTLGAPQSSFDMRRVLDGGILLARLPKGQIGEETCRLMGSFIVASAWQAATGRARLPEPQRRDACAYLDEAQNFLTLPGSVGDMLAEARGYHLGLVLAHQNLAQMPRETQDALSANARNKIFFACAPEDAHQLQRHTLPELGEHDLSRLDAHHAACRLTIDSRETAAFTLHTRPPKPVVGEATAVRRAAAAAAGPAGNTSAIARLAGIADPDD